jgi:hypothetical protein
VKLRVAGGGGRHSWDVEVVANSGSDMFLGRDWQEFSSMNKLELGKFFVFHYDGAV